MIKQLLNTLHVLGKLKLVAIETYRRFTIGVWKSSDARSLEYFTVELFYRNAVRQLRTKLDLTMPINMLSSAVFHQKTVL